MYLCIVYIYAPVHCFCAWLLHIYTCVIIAKAWYQSETYFCLAEIGLIRRYIIYYWCFKLGAILVNIHF